MKWVILACFALLPGCAAFPMFDGPILTQEECRIRIGAEPGTISQSCGTLPEFVTFDKNGCVVPQ